MSTANTEVSTAKIQSLDELMELYNDGVWRTLKTGGRLKFLHRPFEHSQKQIRLEKEYREQNGLAADASLPQDVFMKLHAGLLRDAVSDFAGFTSDGNEVESKDAAGQLNTENLDKVLSLVMRFPHTRHAAFRAFNSVGEDLAALAEDEEKNSSAPSPIN